MTQKAKENLIILGITFLAVTVTITVAYTKLSDEPFSGFKKKYARLINKNKQIYHPTQIYIDPYTIKAKGNEIHIYFSSAKAYITPGFEDKIIEPTQFDYQNKTKFVEFYRKFHYWQHFIPRYNYWITYNELDTTNVYFFHVKGRFADFEYMLSWETDIAWSFYAIPHNWRY